MKITLYSYNYPTNIINKSDILEASDKVEINNVNLKQPFNIKTPTLLLSISLANLEGAKNSMLANYNYVKINAFYDEVEEEYTNIDRYYFINSITYLNGDIIEFNLIIDSLFTYKDIIDDNDLLIERTSGYINIENYYTHFTEYDNLLPKKLNISLDKTQLINTTLDFYTDYNPNTSYGYVFTSITNNPTEGGYDFNPIDNVPLYALGNPNEFYDTLYVVNDIRLSWISKAIYDDNTLLTYAKGLVFFPFDIINKSSLNSKIYIGNKYIGDDSVIAEARTLNRYTDKYEVGTIDFSTNERTKDVNLFNSNCSKVIISIPFYKTIQLDYNDVQRHTLTINFYPNYITGMALIKIYTEQGRVIYSDNFQLGKQLTFNSNNQRQIDNQSTSIMLNSILGGVSSILSTGIGITTGNPMAVVGGVLSASKTITGSITGFNQLYSLGTIGTTNDSLNYFINNASNNQKINSAIVYYDYASNANDFIRKNGLLYNKIEKPNSNLAYFRIGTNQHLTSNNYLYPPTIDILDDIIEQLEQGVYYDLAGFNLIPQLP